MLNQKNGPSEPSKQPIPLRKKGETAMQRFDSWVQKKTRNIGIKKSKAYFIESMSMLLDSGMDVLSMLQALNDETTSSNMKHLISELERRVASGTPFWLAMKKTKVFPDYTISMIQIGEESGRLRENLKSVCSQERKNEEFRSRVRSAMMYPVLVFFLSIFVGLGIAWFILPRLANVFTQLKLDLPSITSALIYIGHFLDEYGLIVVPAFLFTMTATFYLFFLNEKTNGLGKRMLLILPGIKKLIKEIELARLGYVMGSLLSTGVSILDAFDSLAKATKFNYYQSYYRKVKEDLSEGLTFPEIFEKHKETKRIIPLSVQKMIHAGTQSATLAEAFKNINRAYESKSERTTKNLTVILEPLMLVFVWLGVLMIALAVILPIYSLVGGFNGGVDQGAAPPPSPSAVEEEIIDPVDDSNIDILEGDSFEKAEPQSFAPLTITSPRLPEDGSPVELTTSSQMIEGTVPSDTERVFVNDVELSLFKSGETSFFYVVSEELNNLKTGENIYAIHTESKTGEKGEAVVVKLILPKGSNE